MPAGFPEAHAREAASERALPLVLSALEDQLHRRFGAQTIIAIRTLQFDCCLSTEAVLLEQEARRIGEDLATGIAEDLTEVCVGKPFPHGNWLLFPTLGDFLGSALSFFSTGSPQFEPWPFAEFDSLAEVQSRIASSSNVIARQALAWHQEHREMMVQAEGEARGSSRSRQDSSLPDAEANVQPPAASMGSGAGEVGSGAQDGGSSTQDGGSSAQDGGSSTQDKHFPTDRKIDKNYTYPPAENSESPTVSKRSEREVQTQQVASQNRVLNTASPSAAGEIEKQGAPKGAIERVHQPVESEQPLDATNSLATRMAGFVYLIRPILELDIAEHLWAVGLVESEFLARVALHIAQSSDHEDPACRLLFATLPPQDVAMEDWAANEIQDKTLLALERCYPVASQELGWCSQRFETSLVEGLASVLTTVINLRLGCEAHAPLALLHLGGTFRETADTVELMLDASAIDIEIRLAGLDVNPGYVPWLGKSVSIIYRGLEIF
mgnify:CR=1 FL=1|tara:strand:+ start:5437 stop:6921 length:1485 start_codon:yes stop_codon:yes gene_type:complete